MSCLHCEGEFTASDRESRFDAPETRANLLLHTVESLLGASPPPMVVPTR